MVIRVANLCGASGILHFHMHLVIPVLVHVVVSDLSSIYLQKYVAYLDLGGGMSEEAMERWASTGTVPGKQRLVAFGPLPFAIAYYLMPLSVAYCMLIGGQQLHMCTAALQLWKGSSATISSGPCPCQH